VRLAGLDETRVLIGELLDPVEADDPLLPPRVQAGARPFPVLRLVDLRRVLVGEDRRRRLPVLAQHGHPRDLCRRQRLERDVGDALQRVADAEGAHLEAGQCGKGLRPCVHGR
jgi:hypothetical protein